MSPVSLHKYSIEDLEDDQIVSEILSLRPTVSTPYRIESYKRNPRAKRKDTVFYILKRKEQVIAYRSLLSDYILIDDEAIHIAWFSGNYVIPEERRKGYSSRLLKEVEKDWKDRLLFSNFAWPSKYVLDQNSKYKTFHTLTGSRYYFRFGLAQLLPPKGATYKNMEGALFQADRFLNTVRKPFFRTFTGEVKWDRIEFPDEQDFRFMEGFRYGELFKRGKEEFQWIMDHPWISCDQQAKTWQKDYHFSVYAHRFDLSFHRLRKKGETIGLMLMSLRDGVMKLPYIYLTEEAVRSAAELLLKLAGQHKVLHMTLYHSSLINALNKFQGYFLFSKKFEQAFLCHQGLLQKHPSILHRHIHKGDGDAVFT